MERLHSLTNCQSFDRAIEIINNNATEYDDCYTSDYLAGQYAYEAALDAGFPNDQDNLEAHLEFIADNGAKFDKLNALNFAKQFAEAFYED